MKIDIPFDKFTLNEKDGIAEFHAEVLEPGEYNGLNLTIEEISNAANSWIGKDVLVGHAPYSDFVAGEIKQSVMNDKKLIQDGTITDPTTISLIKKGKLKPSIGANYTKLSRKDGKLTPTGLSGDHLGLVRFPAYKLSTIGITMSELLNLVYKSVDELPVNVKDNLPTEASKVYMEAYNRAMTGTCKDSDNIEECCAKVAWAAVKGAGYAKDEKSGKWIKNVEESYTKEQLKEMLQSIKDHPDMTDQDMLDMMKEMIK